MGSRELSVMKGMSLLPPNPVATLYSMLRHPYVAREQLVAFQNKRLRRLVDHAYRNVAYYRRLFDRHRLKPNDIRTVEDLVAVPITSRSALQALPVEAMVAHGVDPGSLITRSSSGSSGRPLSVRRTWTEERLHGAFRLRGLRSLGLQASDRNCMVLRPQNEQPQDHQMIQQILAKFGIARQLVINAMQSPEDIVETLQKFRPAVVSGYPGVLARMTQTVNSEALRSLRLRFVYTGGEVLTPLMRQQIQGAFSVPIYDTYGSIEFNLLAWECQTTGEYHSCDDGLILEVLRAGVPVAEGERGEVVATDLHSFAMPLIRYRIGDVVTKGSQVCQCAQPFSTIRSIQGRMIDYFVLTDNRVVHPYEFGVLKIPWIRAFQVTQERVDFIVMKVVPFHKPSAQEMASLVQPVAKLLGPAVQFQVNLVSEIPLDANGKFRVYRSRIRSAYDEFEWPDEKAELPFTNEPISESHGKDGMD
ncbi:MAG: phenylacetate--CoA ligase family protein [Nitrospirales bacterium]|nr:phenylacetate--CoA ligase family protein [Nitrospirales bacterium]